MPAGELIEWGRLLEGLARRLASLDETAHASHLRRLAGELLAATTLPEPTEGLYRLVDAADERRSVAISSNLHPSGFDELMPGGHLRNQVASSGNPPRGMVPQALAKPTRAWAAGPSAG